MLSGVLELGTGEKLTGHSSQKYLLSGKKLKHRYYQVICSDGVVKRYPAKPIEGVVVKRMKDFVSSNVVFMTLFAGTIKQDKSNLSEVSKKISSAKVRIQTLKEKLEVFNQNMRAVMSDTSFAKEAVISLLDERSQLESEITQGEVGLLKLKRYYDSLCDDNLQVDFHKRLTKFVRAYDGLPNCDKKQIIQSLFPKIILESEDTLKILVNPAFDEQGCDEREKIVSKKWRVRRSSPELFTPDCYLIDIIQLPVKNPPLDLSSLLVDYEEKGLSLRQIAAKKVHSRSTIQKNLKRADVRLRAPGHNYGNPAQLKFGFKKKEGIVSYHKGEQLIIEVIMDFRDDGLTFRQIAQRMTALNIPSKNGKKKWHPMMVKRIIDTYKSSKEGEYEEK